MLEASKIVSKVREFSDLLPDFVYTRADRPGPNGKNTGPCSYLPDEHNPLGCIVGAAVHDLYPDFDLTGWAEIGGVLDVFEGAEFTYLEYRWLEEVQGAQDEGSTWRDAVIHADHATGHIGDETY